jgi:hypothetical protein
VVKVPKHIKWANSFAGWIATLFPNVWGGILTTAAATAAAVWGLGIRFLESTSVQSVILLFVSFRRGAGGRGSGARGFEDPAREDRRTHA